MGAGVGIKNISINNENVQDIFSNGIYESMISWNILFLCIIFTSILLAIIVFFFSDFKKITKYFCLFAIFTITTLILSYLTIFTKSNFQEKLIITDNVLTIKYADGSIKNIKKNDISLLSLSGTDATCTDLTSIITSKENVETPLNIFIPIFSNLFCNIDPTTGKLSTGFDIHRLYQIDLNDEKQWEFISGITNNTNYINNVVFEGICIIFTIFFLIIPMKFKNIKLKLRVSSVFAIPLICLLTFSGLRNESHYAYFSKDNISAYFFNKPSIHIKKEDIKDLKILYKIYSNFLIVSITDKNNKSYDFSINTDVDKSIIYHFFKD